MRELLDVVRFEFRYQLRSPFFLSAVVVIALIHLMAISGVAIHIDISNQVALNGTYAILQTELALFVVGMLPILAFVTTSITRDFEHSTTSLIYVTPISPRMFILGRFLGAFGLALLVGLAGLLGSMLGTFMPWLDQERIASFSLLPWIYIFLVFILPGTLILCTIFFSVAALTRSFALTYAAAMTFLVADVLLNLFAQFETPTWAAMSDPSGRLTVVAETRYWTVAELNIKLPVGLLPQNRLLWLMVALLALLFTLLRFRLDLAERKPSRFKRSTARWIPPPAVHKVDPVRSFSARASFAQLISQLKMDLFGVFKSPLIYIILVLAIASMFGEFQGSISKVGLEIPLYPLTSLMLPFLRYGILQFILLIGVYYSAELIHRERSSDVSEIVNASPFPDWVIIISKTIALCLIINAVMLVAVLTLMVMQISRGYTNLELGLYVKSAFVYNGLYYCMLCILAVVIQTISPNKWLGMLLTLTVYIGLLSLGPMGFDHLLYNFGLPEAIYSDINGFGHYLKPVLWLIPYWGVFCILLLIGAHLIYPRGNYFALRERLNDARSRIGAGVKLTAGLAALAFVGIGAWIFYNTNIVNEYVTPYQRLQRQADYEKAYGQYESAPAPSFESIEMAIDIFPEERRLESRGTATLGNHKTAPINEFVISVKPVLRVNEIVVENATLAKSDKTQGFYLFRLGEGLAPGAAVKMTWNVTRKNEGFVAVDADDALVSNGTYLATWGVMPIPGYDGDRRIKDNEVRRKYGLPIVPRTAALGDPAHQDTLAYGIDSRTQFEITLSTSADQVAVAPGVLRKEWQQDGRRYFNYKAEEPILPSISINSARYEVVRDRWNDVALEIYYDPKHSFNVAAIMETAKRALEFYSTEFAPYQYSYLRILECPRYLKGARFHPGTVPYSEAIFVNDLRKVENADYGIMHELAHMWWGDRIIGAQMQGRQMLNETMAEYSTQMLFKEYYSPVYVNKLSGAKLDAYLNGRSQDNEAEVPVMYTEDHGYLRAKGPLVLYALQDIIGKEKVHQALRNFLRDYSFKTSPCPTSRDLVDALRAEAGPEYQQLITDLFERIVLYDLRIDSASARQIDGGYEVAVEVTAKQLAADGRGRETEEPLDTWFDVAVFAENDEPLERVTPLCIEKHRLNSGKQMLTIRTLQKPGVVAVDPFHKRIERTPGNNSTNIGPSS